MATEAQQGCCLRFCWRWFLRAPHAGEFELISGYKRPKRPARMLANNHNCHLFCAPIRRNRSSSLFLASPCAGARSGSVVVHSLWHEETQNVPLNRDGAKQTHSVQAPSLAINKCHISCIQNAYIASTNESVVGTLLSVRERGYLYFAILRINEHA